MAIGRLAESSRVEAFSDGVFAIALTLLVLDLHAPQQRGHFGHALIDQWQAYLAYVAAFLLISSIWISHHDLFTRVHRVDARLMTINLALLFASSLFPYPASVLASAMRTGDHGDQVYSCALFAALGLLIPLTWIGLYGYLERHPTLLNDPRERDFMRAGVRRTVPALVAFPLGVLVSLASPVAALVIFVAMPMFFIGAVVHAPVDDLADAVAKTT